MNNRVRAVDPRSGAVVTLAGNGAAGAADGGAAAAASFSAPSGVAVDAQGGVLVADTNNHVIRRIARQ